MRIALLFLLFVLPILGFGQTQPIPPNDFAVTHGTYESGTLDSLLRSDDAYVVIRQKFPFSVVDPNARIVVFGTAGTRDINILRLLVEVSSNASPGTRCDVRVELFNFALNRWEVFHETTSTQVDSVIPIEVLSNHPDYIQEGTTKLAMRVSWFDRGTVSPNWTCRTDFVQWSIGFQG